MSDDGIPQARLATRGALIVGIVWLMVCVAGILVAWRWPGEIADLFASVSRSIRGQGVLGAFGILVLSAAIAASGVLPASLVGIGAGALYGIGMGLLVGVAATFAGAALSFWLSRSWLRPIVEAHVARRQGWKSLDDRLGLDGWRIVCLLRVSPVMPFAATSFSLGLTSIQPRSYFLGTLAAMPALCGFVAIGAAAGGLDIQTLDGFGSLRLALLGVGGIATVWLSTRIGGHILAARRQRGADEARPGRGRT